MNSLNVNIVDLSDEILLHIFKKINNVELLYSIVGINQRLDKIACDISLTHSLDLTHISLNDRSNSRMNEIFERLSMEILPRISHKIEFLAVQASIFPRIFRSTNYPNLRKLTLDNVELDMAPQIFNKRSSFIRLYKHQISYLVVRISDAIWQNEDIRVSKIYVGILSWFSNLQYLDLDGIVGNRFKGRLLRGLSPDRCYSSGVTHLRIKIHNFDDCLCLIDGRLSQLHTLIVNLDFVRYSTININNQSTLLKLQEFSLYINRPTVDFDSKVVPLLRRMSNIKKLTLSFRVRRRSSFIDGIYLKNEVFNFMPNLNRFIFDIVCDDSRINSDYKPSSDYIRRTFIENGYDADCYIDYYRNELARSHIYSLPFTMDCIHYITSRFPGGTFMNVRILRMSDIARSFESTFFVKISRSFPMLSQLSVSNTIERLEKPSWIWNKSKELSSIIVFPHLTELILHDVHIDYVEQFLSNFNTRLPLLNKLHVNYEHLLSVTNNFTRNQTRINCSKLKSIIFNKTIHLVHSKDFYLYFPSL